MISYNKETPILIIVLGEIEFIRQIINQLQHIEPQRLYVFFDEPICETEKNNQVRIQSIFRGINWNCNIKYFINKTHLGNEALIMSAIYWFFNQETEGIVLDSLSVPYPAFYTFCSCLLEKYRYDERIGHISGWDFRKPDSKAKINDSYYFSKLIHVNRGWASWKRVLKEIDIQLKTLPNFEKFNVMEHIPTHKPFQFQWLFDYNNTNKWEMKYEYINLINNRMAVVPNMRKIEYNEYELADIIHPIYMVNLWVDDLKFQELKYRIPAVSYDNLDSTTFLREKLLSYSEEARKRMKIPRIVHQIYEDPAGPPVELLKIAETWKKNMPDWEYRFWNRNMICEFLTSVCPDFISYYLSYPFNVQRWDAIRYLILYHVGGMYVDFDYECLYPLDVLFTDSTCCMGMEPTINSKVFNKNLIIGNALMAAKPYHPYMAAIIQDMKANFTTDYKKGNGMQIMESTGPFMVTRVYEKYEMKKEISLLPSDCVAPLTMREVLQLRAGNASSEIIKKIKNAYAIHYFMGTWFKQAKK